MDRALPPGWSAKGVGNRAYKPLPILGIVGNYTFRVVLKGPNDPFQGSMQHPARKENVKRKPKKVKGKR